jgi:hypothetical protein
MFARAAMQAGAVRIVAAYKGAGQIHVPTAENAGDNADLVAETAYFLIIYKFGYLVLFKNCLHNVLAIKLSNI